MKFFTLTCISRTSISFIRVHNFWLLSEIRYAEFFVFVLTAALYWSCNIRLNLIKECIDIMPIGISCSNSFLYNVWANINQISCRANIILTHLNCLPLFLYVHVHISFTRYTLVKIITIHLCTFLNLNNFIYDEIGMDTYGIHIIK